MQVRKQQLEPDVKQLTGWFKIGKGVQQGYILSPWLFNFYAEYIMGTARMDESKWNEDCWEKYQQPQICRRYHFNGRKWREKKQNPKLLRVKEESEKADLKLHI